MFEINTIGSDVARASDVYTSVTFFFYYGTIFIICRYGISNVIIYSYLSSLKRYIKFVYECIAYILCNNFKIIYPFHSEYFQKDIKHLYILFIAYWRIHLSKGTYFMGESFLHNLSFFIVKFEFLVGVIQ